MILTSPRSLGLSLLFVGMAAASVAAAEVQTVSELPASVSSFTAADGDTYFAFILKGKAGTTAGRGASEHVVLVDTSASQKGEHRTQALAVVKQFLASLPEAHRVSLFAVDVAPQPLTEGFIPPTGAAATAAVKALEMRIPAGATNMLAALTAAGSALGENAAGSILYIGDGMSTADLVRSPDLKALLDDLRGRRVPVHSYAVGPRTDLPLLGLLGQYTGGVVMFDHGSETKDAPQTVAEKLAAAVQAPVFYPSAMQLFFSDAELLPNVPLPVRTDRETIYLGKGQLDEKSLLSLTGTGREPACVWSVGTVDAQSQNSYLAALWNRATRDDGFGVPLAGLDILHVARADFDQALAQMVAVGEQAVATGRLEEAEKVALEIERVDPGNIRGTNILKAVTRFQQAQLVAQADQAGTAAENQPAASQPAATEPQPAAAAQPAAQPGTLLNDPAVIEKVEGASVPSQEDLIRRVEELQKIREQQLQLEVSRNIEQARGISTDDPQAALTILKRTLGAVSATTDINPEIRQQLTKRISSVQADIQSREEANLQKQIQAAEAQAQIEAQKRLVQNMQLEEERLEQLIDRVRALLDEARHGNDAAYGEAESVADAAIDLRPGNAPAMAARVVSEASGQLNSAFRLRHMRANQFLATLEQVENSHVPFPDEPPIVWPPADVWKALTERRKKWAAVDLHATSPAEERISQALSEETEVEFVETPLRDAMAFLQDLHNITIVLNKAALAEESIAEDEPINQILSGITLRSALRIILGPYRLTYIIEDEVMKITTELDAETRLYTRVYPVGDLVIPATSPAGMGGGMGGGMMGGMGGGMGGMGMGGGMGGMGGGMGGMGGGGGGFFSVPPESIPGRPLPATNAVPPVNKPASNLNNDVEVQQILDGILGNQTSRLGRPRPQAFAQVRDTLPEKPFRFDNANIEALKKKAASR